MYGGAGNDEYGALTDWDIDEATNDVLQDTAGVDRLYTVVNPFFEVESVSRLGNNLFFDLRSGGSLTIRSHFSDGQIETVETRVGDFAMPADFRGTASFHEFLGLSASPTGEFFIGTGRNDSHVGTAGGDRLEGRAGNDTLIGGDGPNDLFGGPGNDLLQGGPAWDIIFGGAGNDTLIGGGEEDNLWGGDGNDRLEGSDDDQDLNGGAGNDTLIGGADDDNLNGDAGNDLLRGGDGEDDVDGGPGNDLLYGDAGPDEVEGGPGADVMVVGAGDGGPDFAGADRILDFQDRTDKIGLAGLTYAQLVISPYGPSSTAIAIGSGATTEYLAILANILPSQITVADFVIV